MTITIKRDESTIHVSFPFELKDIFRKAFPRAKWNRDSRTWSVSTRSASRLDKWVEEVKKSGVLEEIAGRDEAEFATREVESLARDLAQIKGEVSRARKSIVASREKIGTAEALRAQLEAAKSELEIAQAEKASVQAKERAARKDIESRISHITTASRIERLRREMLNNYVPRSSARTNWENAQSEISKINRELEAIGIKCRATKLAAAANFNRPDRDKADLTIAIEFIPYDPVAA